MASKLRPLLYQSLLEYLELSIDACSEQSQ